MLHGVRWQWNLWAASAGVILLMKACADEFADWAWSAQEARAQLDTAVQRLGAASFETPDWAAAQHQWQLGQVLWDLGDAHHDAAKAAWIQAITIEGPCQVQQHRLLALLLPAKPCADVCHPRIEARYCSCYCQMGVSRVRMLNKAIGSYQ